ncbi:MAG: AEC family transporter [Coleofasciculaceae cyanobacterium]
MSNSKWLKLTEILLNAYTPLILWTGLGLLLFKFIPQNLPRLLGRGLYWLGVPLEILALARRTKFSEGIAWSTTVVLVSLMVSLTLAWLSLQLGKRLASDNSSYQHQLQKLSFQGSFILSATLGNTGFIGLAIAPLLVNDQALNLVVFYSISQNILGTYGIGVLVASYFGHSDQYHHWWVQIRDVLSVPSLWAFIVGFFTRSVALPASIESGLQASVWIVIPCAFLLMGIRLGQIQGWKSFQMALLPSLLKVVILPIIVGFGTTLLGIPRTSQLALVLMSGMPTAFASLILAEEYELERDTIASSIVLTSTMLLLMIPLWLALFGEPW